MMRSFKEWMSEGETIYSDAMKEYQAIQSQIAQLESRLEEKKTEVNQIAQMMGKPPVEQSRRLSAHLVENDLPPMGTIGSVTRALTGRGIVAR